MWKGLVGSEMCIRDSFAVPMLDCSTLRFRRLCYVRHRLVWRPLPHPWSALRFQCRPCHHRSSYPWIRRKWWCTLLWRVPCHGRCQCQRSSSHELPGMSLPDSLYACKHDTYIIFSLGQQYQRSMEARLLLCYSCRLRRSWWHCRYNDVQIRGSTGLHPRY